MVRLFVGGVPSTVSAPAVAAKLSSFGTVGEVELVQDTAGSVRFAYAEVELGVDFGHLVATLRGARWAGRTMRVEKAKPTFTQRLQAEWDQAASEAAQCAAAAQREEDGTDAAAADPGTLRIRTLRGRLIKAPRCRKTTIFPSLGRVRAPPRRNIDTQPAWVRARQAAAVEQADHQPAIRAAVTVVRSAIAVRPAAPPAQAPSAPVSAPSTLFAQLAARQQQVRQVQQQYADSEAGVDDVSDGFGRGGNGVVDSGDNGNVDSDSGGNVSGGNDSGGNVSGEPEQPEQTHASGKQGWWSDGDDDGQDDEAVDSLGSTDDDAAAFAPKPALDAPGGHALLQQQSRFHGDARFKLDERFLDDSDSDDAIPGDAGIADTTPGDEGITTTTSDPGSAGSPEDVHASLVEERDSSLALLAQLLPGVRRAHTAHQRRRVSWAPVPRFDPDAVMPDDDDDDDDDDDSNGAASSETTAAAAVSAPQATKSAAAAPLPVVSKEKYSKSAVSWSTLFSGDGDDDSDEDRDGYHATAAAADGDQASAAVASTVTGERDAADTAAATPAVPLVAAPIVVPTKAVRRDRPSFHRTTSVDEVRKSWAQGVAERRRTRQASGRGRGHR